MVYVNSHFLKLKAGYLFPEIGRRVKSYAQAHPDQKIIRLGIGDVTQPLAPAVLEAFHQGVDDLSRRDSFAGYGPEQGYDFLISTLIENVYKPLGVGLAEDEIFISDGSKCDCANILDIFGFNNQVAIPDPVYPVYYDTNVIAGRFEDTGAIETLPCVPETGFLPSLPTKPADIIYLCFPNNPTGTVASKEELKKWVDYAREHGSIILFDAAYEVFITTPNIVHSIYEIEGAKECAIEFRSFSKTAGFTGVRCGFTVVPHALMGKGSEGENVSFNKLWTRRQTTKFNGASYPVQKAAAAVYTKEGWAQVKKTVAYYMENARLIREGVQALGAPVYGGVDAPYIWMKTPEGLSSWDFFDKLLNNVQLVGTPGSGFGSRGEGYFRFSAFGERENVLEALERLKKL